MKTPIKSYTFQELQSLIKEMGYPSFRATQIYQWLYQKDVESFESMTNLPQALKNELNKGFSVSELRLVDHQISRDKTNKLLFALKDGATIETVAIPSRDNIRLTVCFSTQAGCPIGCQFCATGLSGFSRNLQVNEIIEQILSVQKLLNRRVSNIVGMGQGEPFLNYENTLKALKIVNDPKGIGIGARHISLSSCGIISGIRKFSYEPEQYTLAVSLHSAIQSTRDTLMPSLKQHPLPALKKALISYTAVTNRRVSLEYIMIKEVNDTTEHLKELALFCKNLRCHINLIPINSTSSSQYKPSQNTTLFKWVNHLKKCGIETTIRDSRGSDIDGACGQLKNTYNKKKYLL